MWRRACQGDHSARVTVVQAERERNWQVSSLSGAKELRPTLTEVLGGRKRRKAGGEVRYVVS